MVLTAPEAALFLTAARGATGGKVDCYHRVVFLAGALEAAAVVRLNAALAHCLCLGDKVEVGVCGSLMSVHR